MPDSAQSIEEEKSRRLRPRFRLRTLMVVVTIFCVWLGWHIYETRRQREVVQAIRDAGGEVRYSYQVKYRESSTGKSPVPQVLRLALGDDFFHPVVAVELDKKSPMGMWSQWPLLDGWTERLPEVWHLEVVDTVGDDELREIGRLEKLKVLTLYDARESTDTGAAHLAGLRDLEELVIYSPKFTDATLETLSQLPRLEKLYLTPYGLTDKGVARLRGLKTLRSLDLSGQVGRLSEISDKGLEFLLTHPDFTNLNVTDLQISDAFLERVKKRFPRCQITK